MRWLARSCPDWQVGSTITWHMRGVTIADPEQVVLESEPYRRLSYTWHTFTPELAGVHDQLTDEVLAKAAAEARSKVTFEIEPLDELCKLTVVHDGLDWRHVLSDLKTLLETGETLSPGERR